MGEKRNLKNGRLMIIAILIANIIYSACIIILLVICVTAPRRFIS
ncbi:MAG: hypothetical protein E6X34_06980 [Clostridium sp.]|nr:hypothetical protein [Clostridium sp.]MDU4938183.1 hypothetical protein [Clostridium sp.]